MSRDQGWHYDPPSEDDDPWEDDAEVGEDEAPRAKQRRPRSDSTVRQDNIPDARYYVDGRRLVIEDDELLPQRCIRTNQPVSQREMVQTTLYYVNPLWWFLFPVGILPLALIMLLVRKPVRVTYGLKSGVKWKGYGLVTLCIFVFITGAVGMFVLFLENQTPWGFLVLGLAIASLFCILRFQPHPVAVRYDGHNRFWLHGCSRTFLDSL